MRSTALVAPLLLAFAAPADAALLTFTWTGTVTQVDAGLSSAISIGDLGSGSFQIESTTVDNAASPTLGDYAGPKNMSITLGGATATSALGTIGGLSVFDGSFDGMELDTGPWSGAPVGGLDVRFAALNLEDADATAFASDAIPTSLNLADFEIRIFRIGFGDGTVQAIANVESITISVPEPGATALLALALLGLRRRPSR